MQLSELFEDDAPRMQRLTDLDVTGLTADSRGVEPGFLFAALPGSQADGRAFIGDAVKRGAVAVLAPDGTTLDDTSIQLITDANPRLRFSQVAARYYAAQPEVTAAVTGTNGKTSVAHFLQQIWAHAGLTAASLGTLGVVSSAGNIKSRLTTPDPVSLHKVLADLHEQGVDHLALEASSHGLDQFRLDGVKVRAAAFTNLSRDHLDYHGSMDAYLAAKLRLFTDVLVRGGAAVVNADAPECDTIVAACKTSAHDVLTYGFAGKDIQLTSVEASAHGQALSISILGQSESFALPLVGHFQVMNALCAAGLALATGMDSDQVIEALSVLKGVPGRMEYVGSRANGAMVFVDYAHTPDALATALEALRPHTDARLLVVFGAGGNRDKGKRALMGKAAQVADIIYVTDDNPRTENPRAIRAEILKTCDKAIEIGYRREAIGKAISNLSDGDILLIAGKGHETGQIVGEKTQPFDDRDVARTALKNAEARS